MKFRPKSGDRYWFVEIVSNTFYLSCYLWEDCSHDYDALKMGNCYKTKTDAAKTLRKIKKIFKGAK